jgi:hypothetical protein
MPGDTDPTARFSMLSKVTRAPGQPKGLGGLPAVYRRLLRSFSYCSYFHSCTVSRLVPTCRHNAPNLSVRNVGKEVFQKASTFLENELF